MVDADVRRAADIVDGMSIVQNQKLRRSTSVGRGRVVPGPAFGADRGVVEHVVDAVDEHRHPADAALARTRCSDLGKRAGMPRPQPVGRGDDARSPGTATCTARAAHPASGPRVHDDDPLCRQTTVRVSSHAAQERIPVVGVHRRQPEVDRVLGEAHGLEAALGVAAHVVGRDLGIARATRAAAG